MAKNRFTRPVVLIPLLTVALVVGGIGLYLFQPWKLFVDETVDEELPVAAGPVDPAEPVEPEEPADSGDADSEPDAVESEPAATGPVTLSSGTFISHEHSTSGTVQILELADGTRVLRIEDLDTSNGPDLKVWLTDAPVIEGLSGWRVFDDGQWVDLGRLKGNIGSQNYEIPADVDLSAFSSVSIWCDRFNVSFGAAELA